MQVNFIKEERTQFESTCEIDQWLVDQYNQSSNTHFTLSEIEAIIAMGEGIISKEETLESKVYHAGIYGDFMDWLTDIVMSDDNCWQMTTSALTDWEREVIQ